MKIKRLTEEIGFNYTEKPKEEKVSQKKKKKGDFGDIKALLFILKPVLKEAHDAGKVGKSFDDWWNEYTNFPQISQQPDEESPVGKSVIGFRH
jgi:hypothetical protein